MRAFRLACTAALSWTFLAGSASADIDRPDPRAQRRVMPELVAESRGDVWRLEPSGAHDELLAQDDQRRRPGVAPRAAPVEPPADPRAVPPPTAADPSEFLPIPDRWRLIEALGVKERWFDPYNQNTLKGDRPLFDDWFAVISVISDTVFEPRRLPFPVGGQTTARPGSNSSFGRYRSYVVNQNLITSLSVIKGMTAFKPPDYELRFTPVFNVNYAATEERRLLKADPRRGTTRTDGAIGIQEAFFDYHIRNVSDRYDFDSIRFGVQPFSSDYRGFLFQDSQLGVRLFGNRDNNRWQYNVVWFRRAEKDTNSGLNNLGKPVRRDDVFGVNLYRQDLPVFGFTPQLSWFYNRNREAGVEYYDRNGFLQRPAILGDQRGRDYDVHYVGFAGDGHFDRINLTHQFYYATGSQRGNPFIGTRDKVSIGAFMVAVEPSIDFDWIRLRLSGMYASGDRDPTDKRAGGFDAIFENPQFAGADTSYWIRQGIPFIGGGGVGLSGRNALLPALRPSKEEGQSNFINPGLILLGFGADFDITPEFRLSGNVNHLSFANTSSLRYLRNQNRVRQDIGWDVSAAAIYRPGFIQNLVFRLSGAVLLPGQGLKDLFDVRDGPGVGGNFLYSILFNAVLTY
jgi:hypothetical protein